MNSGQRKTSNDDAPAKHKVSSVGSSRVIQPLHAEAVKAYVAENHAAPKVLPTEPVVPTDATQPLASAMPTAQPATDAGSTAAAASAASEMPQKPEVSLASCIPFLRHYSMVLLVAVVIFAYACKGMWDGAYRDGNLLMVLVLYGVLASMFVAGLVMRLSASKRLVQTSLNVLVACGVLFVVASLLGFVWYYVVLGVFFIVSLLAVKDHVRLGP